MEQPLTPTEAPTAGDALTAAAARLERAVAGLEARLGRPAAEAPPAAGDALALQGALSDALERERELQKAAAAASQALGHALEEVRRTLEADELAPEQGLLDLAHAPTGVHGDLALESAAQSLEDGAAEGDEAAPEKEPAA